MDTTWTRGAPLVAVAAAVGWGLWVWRPELKAVAYLDDSSMHEQMVRFTVTRLQHGHLPQTSWFPYLGLGSPHLLHYQSLPALLTGVLGLATGGDAAFRWSLYLLLSMWPLPVYWSARLFGLERWPAAVAASAAPFLMSTTGVGYEPKAYVWIGFGVWTQLWASWTLPLAWAFTWRAMTRRRDGLPAAVLVALTASLHFETGYLALVPVALFPFLRPGPLRTRVVHAAAVGLGALGLSAWVTVPLVAQSNWAATNEVLANTGLVNGYGARQVLSWLVTGHLYDAGRLPVVTVLVAVGLVACGARWRRDLRVRPLVALWVMSLLLSFGRTTFGSLMVLLPGSRDIFMRRFMMGVQLAGLYMAGVGAVTLVRLVASARPTGALVARARAVRRPLVLAGGGVVVVAAVLAPAWTDMTSYATANAHGVDAQQRGERAQGVQVGRLIAYVRAHGGGRVYAGMPSNWGVDFTVGEVPVFKYLESKDVDEVGYTLRTASLMTDPEYFFDEGNAGDYPLFGVRYLLLPPWHRALVPARPVMSAGDYRLWVLPGSGYVRVVDTVGSLAADRTNVGRRSVPYLRSSLPGRGWYLTVAYGGAAAAPPTALNPDPAGGPAGRVHAESDDLPDGTVRATVVAHRRAVVVLSASFDPGWRVSVDGRPVRTVMVAPALVAVPVTPGRHRVAFSYGGFGRYPALLAFVAATLVLTAVVALSRTWRRRVIETAGDGAAAWRGTWRDRLRSRGRRASRQDRS